MALASWPSKRSLDGTLGSSAKEAVTYYVIAAGRAGSRHPNALYEKPIEPIQLNDILTRASLVNCSIAILFCLLCLNLIPRFIKVMVSHRSSKKKQQQTRLSFTPLPSSSPAATDLPEHTQTRIANVRYDLMASPTKKRRLAPPSSGTSELGFPVNVPAANESTIGGALPTPEPSSQIQAGHEDGW